MSGPSARIRRRRIFGSAVALKVPAVIVEAPVNGIDEAHVRYNAWQFRQILARGVHGILLCQAETEGAVRAFVEACRYPIHLQGVDPMLPTPLARLGGSPSIYVARDNAAGKPYLRVGLRGQGPQTQVAVLEFSDGFGQTSRLELSGFVSGPALPASTFVLKPPSGFQVLRP